MTAEPVKPQSVAWRDEHDVGITVYDSQKGDRNIAPCSDNDNDSVISPHVVHGGMCFSILSIFFFICTKPHKLLYPHYVFLNYFNFFFKSYITLVSSIFNQL